MKQAQISCEVQCKILFHIQTPRHTGPRGLIAVGWEHCPAGRRPASQFGICSMPARSLSAWGLPLASTVPTAQPHGMPGLSCPRPLKPQPGKLSPTAPGPKASPVIGSCTPPLAPLLGWIQPALLNPVAQLPVSVSTGWGCPTLSALGSLLSPWVMPARPLHLFPNSKIHCLLASPTQVSNKAAQTFLGQNGWNFPSKICPAPQPQA